MRRGGHAAAMLRVSRMSAQKPVEENHEGRIPDELREELRMAPVLPGVAGGKWTPQVRLHAMEFFYANKIRYDRLSDARRVRIRELAIYMCFVGIFTYVAMQSRDTSTAHFYVQGMKNYFENTGMSPDECQNGDKNFFGIGVFDDAYGWYRSVLVARLRPKSGLNADGSVSSLTVLGTNIIIGNVVLRQNRVKAQSCNVPEPLLSRSGTCYPAFEESLEDTVAPQAWYTALYATNGPNATVPSWFTWTPSEGGNYANSQLRATYGTGGFKMVLNMQNTTQAINDLNLAQSVGWLDMTATRAVFAEFTLYNPSVNKFMTAFLLLEVSESSGIFATTTYRVVNLYRFARTSSLIDLIIEGAMFLFVFYYLFVEIAHMKIQGRLYWTVGFNYLSILNILVFIVFLLLELYTILTAQNLFVNNTSSTIDDHALHSLAYYTYQGYNFNAFNALLTWIRLTKYLDLLSGKTKQLSVTLSRSAGDVFIVLLIFIVIYFGYSLAFHLAFGQDIADFAYVDSSLIALYLTLLGVDDFGDLKASNSVLGPILFITYIIVMVFCIMNMFLTVVMKNYDKVALELEKQPDELPSHIRKVIFRQIKAFFSRKKKTATVAPIPTRHRAAILPDSNSLAKSGRDQMSSATALEDVNNDIPKGTKDGLDDDDEDIVDAEEVFLNDQELAEIFMAEEHRLKILGIHSVEYMKKVADVDLDGEVSVAEIMSFKHDIEGNDGENEAEEMHLIMKVLERTNQIVQEQRALLSLMQQSAVNNSINGTTTSNGGMKSQMVMGQTLSGAKSGGATAQASLSGLFSSNRGFGPAGPGFPSPQNANNGGVRR